MEISRWISLGYTNGAIAKRMQLAPEAVGMNVRLVVAVSLVIEHRKLRELLKSTSLHERAH